MSQNIADCVLKIFKEISKIPRSSNGIKDGKIFHHSEKKILEFLKSWASKNAFDYKVDTYGNICIFVPGTDGRELESPVILQGHMDMVCIKTPDSTHNFETDEIEVIEENGWIRANNTTLGADNGIGISLALTAAGFTNHPPLEILVTATEEIGMVGAIALDATILSGNAKYMINLDSEELGEIIIGCAGGGRSDICAILEEEECHEEVYEISIFGGKGGHSGTEINCNRANVLYEMFQFIYDNEYTIVSFVGGHKDNAIPSEGVMKIGVHDIENISQKLKDFNTYIRQNYDEPLLNYTFQKSGEKHTRVPKKISQSILETLLKNKTGVLDMHADLEGFVQTSLNLGIVQIEKTNLLIKYSIRSSKEGAVEKILEKIESNFKALSLTVKLGERYPGWMQEKESEFVRFIKTSYNEVLGKESQLLSIHAGLECGVLRGKLGENIEIVSIGPNIRGAHTPKESCELQSVEIVGRVLEKILAEIQ